MFFLLCQFGKRFPACNVAKLPKCPLMESIRTREFLVLTADRADDTQTHKNIVETYYVGTAAFEEEWIGQQFESIQDTCTWFQQELSEVEDVAPLVLYASRDIRAAAMRIMSFLENKDPCTIRFTGGHEFPLMSESGQVTTRFQHAFELMEQVANNAVSEQRSWNDDQASLQSGFDTAAALVGATRILEQEILNHDDYIPASYQPTRGQSRIGWFVPV